MGLPHSPQKLAFMSKPAPHWVQNLNELFEVMGLYLSLFYLPSGA